MTKTEVANIAGIALGATIVVGGLFLTIFARGVAQRQGEYAARHFGRRMGGQFTTTNIRLGSIPSVALGVIMIALGVLGKFGS